MSVCRHYPTPRPIIEQALARIELAPPANLRVIEPCAGAGHVVRALAHWGVPPERIAAIELDPRWRSDLAATGCQVHVGCCIDWSIQQPAEGWDLCITNPEFRLAEHMVAPLLRLLRPGGEMWLLNRLQWLAGKCRLELLRRYPPDVFVLPLRPSFVASGKIDRWDYAWYRWVAGRSGPGQVFHLDPRR